MVAVMIMATMELTLQDTAPRYPALPDWQQGTLRRGRGLALGRTQATGHTEPSVPSPSPESPEDPGEHHPTPCP